MTAGLLCNEYCNYDPAMSALNVTLLVVYLGFMAVVALRFSRASAMRDGEDFVLAGRSLSTTVLGATMLATFVGSGSIIGGANFVYTYGPIPGVFFFAGTLIGILCLLVLVTRVRTGGFRTVPELFQDRYGTAARCIGTVMIIIAFVGITAYQFTGAGYIVSLMVPVSETQGAVVAAVLVTVLSMSGGLKSVAWTDALSSALVVLGLFVCLVYLFATDVGGLGGYVDRLDPALSTITGGLPPLALLGYFLPVFLLILGDQNMHQRLSAARDSRTAVRATLLFFGGALLMITPIVLLASTSSFLLPGIEADTAVLALAAGDLTPPVVGGLLLVGAFALIVTTGSSYLLTSSANIVYDLVFLGRPERAGGRLGVAVGRSSVLLLAVLAFVMVQFFPTVLELQMYAYTMYGAALTPVILAALFWRRAGTVSAIATIVVGGAVTVAWEVSGRASELNSVVVSLPAALATLVVTALLFPRRVAPAEEPAAA